jgi:hypothetical protein
MEAYAEREELMLRSINCRKLQIQGISGHACMAQ